MFNGKSFHETGPTKNKFCAVCEAEFLPKSGSHKFCSTSCKGKWQYITGQASTEAQYEKINGNWSRYLSRLLYSSGRKEQNLTRELLFLKLQEQNYLCALTGLPLTCKLEKGTKTWTNASIDRITAGGPYTKDNIQIVCRGVNCWRSDQTIEEFVAICRKVVEHADRGREGQDGQQKA
jgi:hypothetical protein